MDCRLKRNKNSKRCKILRSIRYSPKKDLRWFQAKAKFLRLSPRGDIDKDKVRNKKDCRPFNKKKQDDYEDPYPQFTNRTLLVNPRDFQAFETLAFDKEMGENPQVTKNRMANMGYSMGDISGALSLYRQSKSGRDVQPFYSA
jgi:hypothetical protein